MADAAELRRARKITEKLCDPLEVEDFGVQSMPEVSPPKWHLAHTTWFIEEFLLARHERGYEPFQPEFRFLFNSYYESAGAHLERQHRGLISRPTVREIFRYRSFVDETLFSALDRGQIRASEQELEALIQLAARHEEQHQELLLTDIKHILWMNPSKPSYRRGVEQESPVPREPETRDWLEIEGGLYEIGAEEGQEAGFSFDNERPRHPVYIPDFALSPALVSNGEYLEFMRAGGYRESRYWLSAGWDWVRQNRWEAPLYWIAGPDGSDIWSEMTLSGVRPLEPGRPVAHVSYYEADAFARWRGARLPTEAEWEVVADGLPMQGSFLESGRLHPGALPSSRETPHWQLWGELWQWTSSAYGPYPGFRPLTGAFSEYNGKFMSNQMVLRGGSCVTPRSQMRGTYRNFFPPEARWQFSGIRLAR